MLDVKGSIQNLKTITQEHFDDIQQQQSFTRAFPIHFELAYTDFRMIQLALQLSGELNHSLLVKFTAAYAAVYAYEEAYATEGLPGFNAKFANQLNTYQEAKDQLLAVIAQIETLQAKKA